MPNTSRTNPVRYGFEPEDVAQEFALGRIMRELTQPGNSYAGLLYGKLRVARWKRKEAVWNSIRVPLDPAKYCAEMAGFDLLCLEEIIAQLTEELQKIVRQALESNDGRKIRKAGRLIRKHLRL